MKHLLRKLQMIQLSLLLFCVSMTGAKQNHILALLPDNYGANYFLNMDRFAYYGWEVTTAGAGQSVSPCPIYAGPLGCPTITVDKKTSEITDLSPYDAVIVMSGSHWAGNPCGSLINDVNSLAIISQMAGEGKVVAGMCSGVRVLAYAGVINGVNVTGNANCQNEYTSAGANFLGANLPPVTDGNIVTCARGDYFYIQNCDAIDNAIDAAAANLSSFPAGKGNKRNKNLAQADNFYGGSYSDGARDVTIDEEGNIYYTGYSFSGSNGMSDIYVVKTGQDGNVIWSDSFGGERREYAVSSVLTPGNNLIVAGYTTSYGSGGKDIYIICLDNQGNLLWEKTYGGNGNDEASRIIASGENYFIAGTTDSYGNGEEDIAAILINDEGGIIWEKYFGGNRSDIAASASVCPNGDFVITGSTGSFNSNRDIYLLRINADGEELFHKNYGETANNDWGHDIITSGNDIIICGKADILYQDLYSVFLMKTDASGHKLWEKRISEGSFYEQGNSIKEAVPGIYMISGMAKSATAGNDIYFILADNDGNIIEKSVMGSESSEWISVVEKTGTNQILLSGYSDSGGNGMYDIYSITLNKLIPSFSFDKNSGHAPLTVNFSNKSLGEITSAEWDFQNDGTVDSYDLNPRFIYDAPGQYSVKLKVKSASEEKTIIRENLVNIFDGESAMEYDQYSRATYQGDSLMNLKNNFTLEAWIYPDTLNRIMTVFNKGNIILAVIGANIFHSNSLLLKMKTENGNFTSLYTDANTLEAGIWQHVGLVYSGAQARLYVNGEEINIHLHGAPFQGNVLDNISTPLTIGNDETCGAPFFGAIDEIRIWNSALTNVEIKNMFHSYLSEIPEELLAYYQANEAFGDIVIDRSGNGRHLKLRNVGWRQGNRLNGLLSVRNSVLIHQEEFKLSQNYPNPFNPETTVSFYSPEKAHVTLRVYNILGEMVTTLADDIYSAGEHKIKFRPDNLSGGVYIINLTAENYSESSKIIYLK